MGRVPEREGMIHRWRHGARQQYGMKLEGVDIVTAQSGIWKKYKGWKDKEGADHEEPCLPHRKLDLNLLETQCHWRVTHREKEMGGRLWGRQWVWMQGKCYDHLAISTLQMHNPLQLRMSGIYYVNIHMHSKQHFSKNILYTIVCIGKRLKHVKRWPVENRS